jgi:hypothetical protein
MANPWSGPVLHPDVEGFALAAGLPRLHQGAPKGKANGNYKNGRFTCEAVEARRQLAAWIREMNQLARDVS